MAKKVAPTKSTGGGGFVFEEKAGAYFLACLLTNFPPLKPGQGTIRKIGFQQRADWGDLDDIVLVLESPDGQGTCAFSVKSSRQLTAAGPPLDFVRSVWDLYLGETGIFRKGKDILGLIAPPASTQVSADLSWLLDVAGKCESSELRRNIHAPGYASKERQRIFERFNCPNDLADKYQITEDHTGDLLKHIVILECDFELQNSRSENEAVQRCREALSSGSLDEAQNLWETLQGISRDQRTSGGWVDIERLLNRLRHRFRLKNWPHHEADWQKLANLTSERLREVRTTIGGKVTLARPTAVSEIEKALGESRWAVVIGPSGCGKSVLLRQYSQTARFSTIWFNGVEYNNKDFPTFETELGLQNPLRELLKAAAHEAVFVVIDGLEGISGEPAYRTLCSFIEALGLGETERPYRLAVSCQHETWSRVLPELLRAGLPVDMVKTVQVGWPSAQEFQPVWDAFPQLGKLRYEPRLGHLLLRPKIFDVIATNIGAPTASALGQWAGEADVVDWWWSETIEKRDHETSRAPLLRRLAEKQADELQSETPIDDLCDLDLSSLSMLCGEGLLRKREDRIAFEHDLFGDWIRMRILLARKDQLPTYLASRLSSPMWHHALRLHGARLLEESKDAALWETVFNDMGSLPESGSVLAQDLLLESALFAPAPLPLCWFSLNPTVGVRS